MSRKKKNKKSNMVLTLTSIMLVFLIITFLFYSVNNFITIKKLEAKKESLIEAINMEEEKKLLYMEELEKVGTKEYYEYLARKYLGYIYPDETIMIVTDNNEPE